MLLKLAFTTLRPIVSIVTFDVGYIGASCTKIFSPDFIKLIRPHLIAPVPAPLTKIDASASNTSANTFSTFCV